MIPISRLVLNRSPALLFLCAQLIVADLHAQNEKLLVEGDAFVRSWEPPVLPADLAKETKRGEVAVEFIVDEKGQLQEPRVVESTDPRLDAFALAALEKWSFEPAVIEGKPSPSCLRVPIIFDRSARPGTLPPVPPAALPRSNPEPVSTPDADYPAGYAERQLPGRVNCVYFIEKDGSAGGITVTGASSPLFVGPALAAMRQWRFRPVKQGHLTLRTRHETSFDFTALVASIQGLQRSSLESFGLAPQSSDTAAVWDRPPKVERVIEPVTPYALGIAGTEGSATVEFVVGTNGRVTRVTVRSASSPEFGVVLAVAARGWGFSPASKNNELVEAPLTLTWQFANPQKEGASTALWQQAAAGELVAGSKGLDRKLRPIYREAPDYPEALLVEKVDGKATLEFVIDETGHASLPNVLEASREEFGYEAAQALSHWYFEPPTRDGKLTSVKVKIPFEFTAPKT